MSFPLYSPPYLEQHQDVAVGAVRMAERPRASFGACTSRGRTCPLMAVLRGAPNCWAAGPAAGSSEQARLNSCCSSS